MPCVKIAVAELSHDFSYFLSQAFYSLMPNTKSNTKMQSRTTKPLCYQTCDISATKASNIGKTPWDNLI